MNHGGRAHIEHLPDDVELHQTVDALGARGKSLERLEVEVAGVSDVGDPEIDQRALCGAQSQGTGDGAAAVVAADDDVLDFQDGDR